MLQARQSVNEFLAIRINQDGSLPFDPNMPATLMQLAIVQRMNQVSEIGLQVIRFGGIHTGQRMTLPPKLSIGKALASHFECFDKSRSNKILPDESKETTNGTASIRRLL